MHDADLVSHLEWSHEKFAAGPMCKSVTANVASIGRQRHRRTEISSSNATAAEGGHAKGSAAQERASSLLQARP